MDNYETPMITSLQGKYSAFRTTLRDFKKSVKTFKKVPLIPFSSNLCRRPLCQTMSNTLEVSKTHTMYFKAFI